MNTTSTAAELLTLGKIQAGAAVVLCGLVFSLCVISVVSILTRPKGKR